MKRKYEILIITACCIIFLLGSFGIIKLAMNAEHRKNQKEIQKSKCIFDIGWHIWYFSERCRSLNKDTEIHYFEPVQTFYEKAKTNLWTEHQIILNNYWIWTKTEDWSLLVNTEKTMQSSKYTSFLNPEWIKTKVTFHELKKYIEEKDIKKIDVMKMDVEWMEFEILPSRTDFERQKIQNFIAEMHLLNDKMGKTRESILPKIKNIFTNIEIFNSPYSKDIFLIRCKK